MRHQLWAALALLTLGGFVPAASAQTYEELLKENRELKARLAALQALHDDGHDPHDHAAANDGHDHSCQEHPEDRFDFCRPFHSHCDKHEGEDHADHDHVGDGHEHGLGHDRHESVFGYPFWHALRTEHAFIERKFELQYVRTQDAEDGLFHADQLNWELFWALNNRIAVLLEGPFTWINPALEPNTAGHGDLEVGVRFVAYNGKHTLQTFGLNVETPTGDPDRGLGEGHAGLEPVWLSLYDFGRGWVLQTEFGLEVPIDADEVDNASFYNFALGKTILPSGDWKTFRWLTVFMELNGSTVLNADESGRTVIDLTPGLYWNVTEKSEMGFGVSFPVSGRSDFDYQILLAYFRHF